MIKNSGNFTQFEFVTNANGRQKMSIFTFVNFMNDI